MLLNNAFQFCKKFTFFFAFYCNFLMAYEFQKIQPELERISNKNDIQEFRSYMKLAMSKLTHELPIDPSSALCVKSFYQKITSGCTLPEAGWFIYPSFIKAASVLRKIGTGIDDPSFQVEKYRIGSLTGETNRELYMNLGEAKTTLIQQTDTQPKYRSILGFTAEEEERWNNSCQFLLLEAKQLKSLQTSLDELKQPVSKCIGSPWRVVNVRSWNAKSQEFQAERIGSGMPDSVYTLFLCPRGRDAEGSWVLFKNCEVSNSTPLPLQSNGETTSPVVEITLIPALEYDTRPVEAGLLAIYPILPWTSLDETKTVYPKGLGLNIGAGKNWQYSDWISLERSGDSKGFSFVLSPNCRFPLEDESIGMAYSCHVLEHLDDATVFRVLLEAKRVLMEDSYFVIKIPNFDEALDAWRNRNGHFFSPHWGFPTNLWPNLGVADSLDARAAMIFASFGSPELNGLFSGQEYLDHPRAYFGPPLVSTSYLQDLIQTRSPHEIAFELRKCMLHDQGGIPDLCHQNAWSPEELKNLLNVFGFEVVTFDREKIANIWPHLLWMRDAWHTSTFCLAKKKSTRF